MAVGWHSRLERCDVTVFTERNRGSYAVGQVSGKTEKMLGFSKSDNPLHDHWSECD